MTWTWQNVKSTPARWVAAWLRRRGWVVFYVDGPLVRADHDPGCYLAIYDQCIKRGFIK